MKTLRINSLCGIKNQLYCSNQYIDDDKHHEIKNGFLDVNSIFWSKIFSPNNVKELINLTMKRHYNNSSPKIQAIINSPSVFYNTYIDSLKTLNSKKMIEKCLFECLEPLEIVCYLHTLVHSLPFKLSISSGYICNCYSTLDLLNNCLNKYCNPYLDFIKSIIIPMVKCFNPDIIVLQGKPSLASFSIARLVKEINPNVFIISSQHESDYYSLSKIKSLLMQNTAFFNVYDCIDLYSNPKTINMIEYLLDSKLLEKISNVPGLIYSLNKGKLIETTASPNTRTVIINDITNDVVNINAFPQKHCYWNQCAFCGINNKYVDDSENAWELDQINTILKRVTNESINKIWLLDEAIPVGVICKLAEFIINNKYDIVWHLRTRIDREFTNKSFCNMLKRSGLRHINFGFECASKRILKLMRKTNNEEEYLQISEEIVAELNSAGINVHFSTIIGFPSETTEEREETISFLKYLKDTYDHFSYNVNEFYLDISSLIYKEWERFGIVSLAYPCSPRYYIENHLIWNDEITIHKNIIKEQEEIMKYQYKWYPEGALIKPSVFFSFWEYGRYSLNQAEDNSIKQLEKNILDFNKSYSLSSMVSIVKKEGILTLYNLKNHNYVCGGKLLYDIIHICNNKLNVQALFDKYEKEYESHIKKLVLELLRMDFII